MTARERALAFLVALAMTGMVVLIFTLSNITGEYHYLAARCLSSLFFYLGVALSISTLVTWGNVLGFRGSFWQ